MDGAKKFGRYVVTQKLGQGAMGTVFLAHDPVLERKVALKVISIDAMVDQNTRDDYLKRFSFEAKASAKLDHPSIVAVYDAGEENGLPWIAFQYVQGETLESLLTRKGRLSIERALGFARDIASALQHAHGWSIVHRDIKPANILIESSTGIAKLADFGIVKAPWAVMSHEENTLGSPGYMSPEQIDGIDLDERADIFCLGVVIYQMITGMHPFLRDTMAATIYATCNNDYTPLRDVVPQVPPALDWAVRRCLASDRDKRIRSANELVEMLAKAGPASWSGDTRLSPAGPIRPNSDTAAKPQTFVEKNNVPDSNRASVPSAQSFFRIYNKLSQISEYFFSKFIRKSAIVLTDKILNMRAKSGRVIPWGSAKDHESAKRFYFAAIAIAGGVGFIIICVALIAALSGGVPPLPPPESLEGQLMEQCSIALRDNNRNLAMNALDGLSSIGKPHPHSRVLIARVLIRNGSYQQASKILLNVESLHGGKKIISKELPSILDDASKQLRIGPAPPDLVSIIRYVLLAGKHPIIRSWTQAPQYWLRWNAVDILRLSNVDVDMTSVYILDLSCKDRLQVRLQAVAELGKIGSRSARAALSEAALRDKTDPFVAQEAQRVLGKKQR
jgi:serine/threonine protein kinase